MDRVRTPDSTAISASPITFNSYAEDGPETPSQQVVIKSDQSVVQVMTIGMIPMEPPIFDIPA